MKSIKTNVRVIAATHRDLSEMVKEGSFRQDLFYRVNIVRMEIPDLMKRKTDIPLLIDTFVARLNRKRGRVIKGIDQTALEILMKHDFPGNVRELENIIEHAFILCSDQLIKPLHLPEYLHPPVTPSAESISLQKGRQVSEAGIISEALKKNNYNRLAAAKELGIHKSTLFRKIKQFSIALPQKDGRSKN
jgi:transcriptional regulator with PAS, ATPase and Fis domain